MLHAALGLGEGSLTKPLLWRHCGCPWLAASLQQTAQLDGIMQDLGSPRWACEQSSSPVAFLLPAAPVHCACTRSHKRACCHLFTSSVFIAMCAPLLVADALWTTACWGRRFGLLEAKPQVPHNQYCLSVLSSCWRHYSPAVLVRLQTLHVQAAAARFRCLRDTITWLCCSICSSSTPKQIQVDAMQL